MQGVKIVLAAVLVLALMGTVSAASGLGNDDFEDGDFTSNPAWSESGDSGNSCDVTSSNALSGTYSLGCSGDDVNYTNSGGAISLSGSDSFDLEFYNTGSTGRTLYILEGDTGYLEIDVSNADGGFFYETDQESGTLDNSIHGGNPYTITVTRSGTNQVDLDLSSSSHGHTASANGVSVTIDWDSAKIWFYDNGDGEREVDEMNFPNSTNSAPSIDSTSHSPDPAAKGDSISYTANASDSDGDNLDAWITVEYWNNGTEFISDQPMNEPSTNNFKIEDLYTTTVIEDGYNATMKVSDGATNTTAEENFYLEDNSPGLVINRPLNQTYFDYDQNWRISNNDDGDALTGEISRCNTWINGNHIETLNLTEGTTSTTNSFRNDQGFHTFNASCTELNGSTLTTDKQKFFTVDTFNLSSTSASSQVYETSNQSFTGDMTAGDMVNQVETKLYWDGNVRDAETVNNSGITTFSQTVRHETPLVQSNTTNKSWKLGVNYSYTDFNGNNQSTTFNSSVKQQEVLWSYYLENSYFTPDNKYIETEDLEHNTQVHTETKKADLSRTTTYKRDSSTDSMELVDSNSSQSTYQGVIDTGLADSFNQSSFNAESELTVSFDGDTRTISTGNDQLELYRIQLFDTANPGGLTTEKTLEFDINYEEEDYDTKARLTMDLSVWKNEDEKIRRFQYQEDEATTHSYHIYPSWAEYTIQTKPYPEETKFDLIQYFNPDDNKVRRSYFFPVPQTINNDTTTVPLKTINETEAQQIDFEVTQSGGQPAENVYCRVDRKFGGGDFETVFMIKTGGQGNAQSFAEINEIYYSFTCYKNGEVIETFPAQIMQNPMILNIGETEVETGLDYSDQFDANCTFNTTRISCDYQSQSENLQQAVLEVDRIEPVTDIQICQKSSPTATGTLACNGINTSEDSYRFHLTGEFNNGITITGDSGTTGNQGNQYGAAGILLTLFIFMFVFAATSFNVPLGIGLGTLSLLFSSVAGFFVLTPAMRATLIGLAIVAGVVSRR